ncbi:hypothetical protein C8R46DRAFT_461013 [Mycena filopes]|nr:hypothetical protein C8R46DRAFT_461013 [Mycena filopes]
MSQPQMKVPYYAVIFSSKRKAQEGDGYDEMAGKMVALAQEQSGFLRVESVSTVVEAPQPDRPWEVQSGITISYWADENSIKSWKSNLEHLLAQKRGKDTWYLHYTISIAKVERTYSGGLEAKDA